MAHDLPDPVDPAPGHEVPGRAVPEATEDHRDHDVPGHGPLWSAASPERDVEVVAQPPGQGHVPTTPEVLEVARRVGRVEVVGEPEPEEHGQADGHVGVPAE